MGPIRGLGTCLLLLPIFSAPLLAKNSWVEVLSPHFRVLTDGGNKDALRIASELEMIRSLYHSVIGAGLESGDRITVFATEGEDEFEELLPPSSRKGAGERWAGMFVQLAYGYAILLRLDIQSDFQYRSVYHEYFHYLARRNLGMLPSWLNEGMAEYWETIDIREEEVRIGQPNDSHIRLLRDKTHLPLETLLTADYASPHFLQDQDLILFYAQSWALTHLLQSDEVRRGQLETYVALLEKGAERSKAASEAFGDIESLGEALKRYVRNYSFRAVRLRMPQAVREEELTARSLSEAQALASRGAHLVRVGDRPRGESLLTEALQKDPTLAEAHESLGLLRLPDDPERARASFEEAIRLDPNRYLSHFLIAESFPRGDAAAEPHFLKVLSLAREFAPAYRALAWFYFGQDERAVRSANLARQAVSLEPNQARYRIEWAFFLRETGESESGEREVREAMSLALAAEGPYQANSICWFGSLYGYAAVALPACEAAVARIPESTNFRDSRGLARALTGDRAGAIDDFRFYIEKAPEDAAAAKEARRRWIDTLQKGENPFTEETLSELRGGR